jgi:hypothetical protein
MPGDDEEMSGRPSGGDQRSVSGDDEDLSGRQRGADQRHLSEPDEALSERSGRADHRRLPRATTSTELPDGARCQRMSARFAGLEALQASIEAGLRPFERRHECEVG